MFAALLTVVIVGGCGSSYTKADFVSRANGICLVAVRNLRVLGSAGSAGSAGALAEYLERVLPIVRREARQLRTLPRPPLRAHGRAELQQYFAALSQAVDGYGALEKAAHRGDSAAVASVLAQLRSNPVEQLAARFGLRYCGTPEATGA
jgi:hypothetical protein